MVEKVESPSSAPDFITSAELEEGIINGSITTFTITQEYLPYYQKAADKTGFKVELIADSGQYYITEEIKPVNLRLRRNEQNITPIITAVKSKQPVREGSVGISLKRPEGVTNDTAFNFERQKIQPA